jgi:mannose-6-phosphate isomerase-like protein (cupin superfamily)
MDEKPIVTMLSWQELVSSELGWEFEGTKIGNAGISFLIIEAPSGQGPKLHAHPYEEIFIILAGQATFTVGHETIKVEERHVIIVPAGMPHKFINSGHSVLRQIDIHASHEFITDWLED